MKKINDYKNLICNEKDINYKDISKEKPKLKHSEIIRVIQIILLMIITIIVIIILEELEIQ